MSFHKIINFLFLSACVIYSACSKEKHTPSRLNSSHDSLRPIVGAIPVTVAASERGYAEASLDFAALPAGNGFAPKLSLAYSSSQNSLGLAGVGWDVSGISSIGRCPKHPKFEGKSAAVSLTQDDSLCLDGRKLLLVHGENLRSGASYRLYLDDFKKVDMREDGSFEVRTRSGEVWFYGRNLSSRERGRGEIDTVWYLDRIQDRSGNIIDYEYLEDGHRLFLKRIGYGGNSFFNKPSYRFLNLEYETLPIGIERYSAGQPYISQKLLKKVSAAHDESTLWTYVLHHETKGAANLQALVSIEQCFQDKACLPKTFLKYEGGDNPEVKESESYTLSDFAPLSNPVWAPEKTARVFADINNDGRTDFVGIRKDAIAYSLSTPTGMSPIVEKPRSDLFMWDPRFDMVSLNDINRDGFLDIVLFSQDPQRGGVYVAYWTGDGYSDFTLWTGKFGPRWSVRSHIRLVADANNDGWPDLIGIKDDGVYLMLNKDGVLEGGDQPVLADLGVNAGWNRDRNPRYFADVNGDGILDIIGLWQNDTRVALGTGTGFESPKVWLNDFGYNQYYSTDNLPRMIADMNADGLIDLVGFGADGVYVALNTGREFKPAVRWLDGLFANRGWTGLNNARRMIFDINKDGFPDFVGFRPAGLEVYYGCGAPINGQSATVFSAFSSRLRPWKASEETIQLEDLTSDSNMELLSLLRQGTWSAEIKAQPIRLSGVEDGLGNKIQITYDFLSNPEIYRKTKKYAYPLVSVDGAMQVVRKIQTSNGIGGMTKVLFSYENAAFHSDGFGFIGFEKRTLVDEINATVTIETYSQDTKQIQQGSPLAVEVYKGISQKKAVSRTTSRYITKWLGSHPLHGAVRETENKTVFYDESGKELYSVIVNKEYDDYLNATSILTKNMDAFGIYARRVHSIYSNDEATWNLGLVTRVQTVSSKQDSALPTVTKTVAFTYDSDGRMVTETQEPDSPLWIKKEYLRTHNSFGLVDTTITSWGEGQKKGLAFSEISESITYDGKGFVEKTTNALNQTNSQTLQPDTYLIDSRTDINGLTSYYSYDPSLRLISTRNPNDLISSIERTTCDATCPPLAVIIEKTSTPGFGENTNYVDGLGRVVRSTRSLVGQKKTTLDSQYDDKGLLVKVSKPYFLGEDPKFWIIFTYDERNRRTQTLLPDGSSYQTRYDGLQTTQIDALGRETTYQSDSQGLLLAVTNAKNEVLSYAYDVAGRMIQIKDAGENKTIMDYDVYGRRIYLNDPTTGITRTTYNALGLVGSETRQNTSHEATFDMLGRPLTKTATRPESSPLVETYTYDQSEHGIGKLSQAVGPDSSVVYAYDQLSRPIGSTQVLLGKSYKSSTAYDALGRVSRMTYPSGLAISYGYDEVSQMTEVRDESSSRVYWKLGSLYANGDLKDARLGNGSRMVRVEDERSDRTLSETVLGLDQSLQMARTYEHDLAGNLLSRRDATTGVVESFNYDELNRLTGFTGSDSKAVQLTYDSIGRITARSDLGRYEYGRSCEGGIDSPFAIKKIGTKTFCADNLGNFVKSGDRTLVYNVNNLPTLIRDGKKEIEYQYGLGNAILMKSETINSETTNTLYVGDSYEVETSSSGLKQKHNIGGFLVLETDESGGSEKYLYKDYLGSTLAVADQKGQLLETLDYDPFGQRRDAKQLNWLDGFKPSTTSVGFTGHEHADSVNLIHMKGRMYDPTTGLFLSPDPFVQDPTKVQNLNRYAYVMNNPLSYTDPSGYLIEGIGKAFEQVGRGINRAFSNVGQLFSNFGHLFDNTIGKAFTWLSKANNQRLMASIAISVAGTILSGPSYLAITGSTQMAAYSAAVGYTSAYVASNGNKKAALNGALTGAAFSMVGSAFETGPGTKLSSAMSFGKVVAHGVVGGFSSVANGGRFESGFLSSGLSEFAGFQGLYGNAGGGSWEIALGSVRAAIVGGTISEVNGGGFESGALSAVIGRLMNGVSHAFQISSAKSSIMTRFQLKGENVSDLINDFFDSVPTAYEMGQNFDAGGYISKVETGGAWDYKNLVDYRSIANIEEFGNFAFGTTSQAWAAGATRNFSQTLVGGLTATELALRGAGAYQEFRQKKVYQSAWGHAWDIALLGFGSSYGDDPRDTQRIREGAIYYYEQCANSKGSPNCR